MTHNSTIFGGIAIPVCYITGITTELVSNGLKLVVVQEPKVRMDHKEFREYKDRMESKD